MAASEPQAKTRVLGCYNALIKLLIRRCCFGILKIVGASAGPRGGGGGACIKSFFKIFSLRNKCILYGRVCVAKMAIRGGKCCCGWGYNFALACEALLYKRLMSGKTNVFEIRFFYCTALVVAYLVKESECKEKKNSRKILWFLGKLKFRSFSLSLSISKNVYSSVCAHQSYFVFPTSRVCICNNWKK